MQNFPSKHRLAFNGLHRLIEAGISQSKIGLYKEITFTLREGGEISPYSA
jgi:hypothetical protein